MNTAKSRHSVQVRGRMLSSAQPSMARSPASRSEQGALGIEGPEPRGFPDSTFPEDAALDAARLGQSLVGADDGQVHWSAPCARISTLSVPVRTSVLARNLPLLGGAGGVADGQRSIEAGLGGLVALQTLVDLALQDRQQLDRQGRDLGRTTRPSIDKLAEVARVLKVEREWLIHGIGEVESEPPFIENPDETFVAIAHASPRPSMSGGAVVTEELDTPGRAYHFRRYWIKDSPSQLRIMHVEGDSMAPTLLDDGMGLVAKRLEHVPNSDPPAVRVISDNGFYSPYERSAEEIHIIGRIRWFAREI